MGQRGHTVHVLGGNGQQLSALGHRLVILASNHRWTSFLPMDAGSFDDAAASQLLSCPVLHLWMDDDFGLVAQTYESGALVGELTLPFEEEPAPADLDILKKWQKLGFFRRGGHAALLKRMADTDFALAWTLEHGLERLLALPFYVPMPADIPEDELLSLLPEGTTILTPNKPRKAKAPEPVVAAEPATRSWSNEEIQTISLHCHYWTQVWCLNNWKLYNRYKKHLPAAERPEVDLLCDSIAARDVKAVVARVVSILSRIWTHEDWDKVIRSADIRDGDDREWKLWRAKLDRTK